MCRICSDGDGRFRNDENNDDEDDDDDNDDDDDEKMGLEALPTVLAKLAPDRRKKFCIFNIILIHY